MAKLIFPNGQELEVAKAGFSEDAVTIVELSEEAGTAKETGQKFTGFGKLLRAIRNVMRDSLIKGGASPKEADEAISSIPFDPEEGSEFMAKAREAMGIDN